MSEACVANALLMCCGCVANVLLMCCEHVANTPPSGDVSSNVRSPKSTAPRACKYPKTKSDKKQINGASCLQVSKNKINGAPSMTQAA
jgi:hypothetical protein